MHTKYVSLGTEHADLGAEPRNGVLTSGRPRTGAGFLGRHPSSAHISLEFMQIPQIRPSIILIRGLKCYISKNDPTFWFQGPDKGYSRNHGFGQDPSVYALGLMGLSNYL